MLKRVVILKTNIDKLDYYELLKFCTENKSISNNEKNKTIEKLLDYKKYLDYPKYFEWYWSKDLPRVFNGTNDRKRFIESISSSNDSQIIYTFSISLKSNLYVDEVYILFNSLYNFNNDDCTKSFIDNFFSLLERNINNIISKICDDKNYSLLMDLWTKYKNYLTDSTKMIVKNISESSSSYYMYKLLCDNIEGDNKSLLIKSICNLDDISYICDTIKLMSSNLSSDDINNIVSSYSRTLHFL